MNICEKCKKKFKAKSRWQKYCDECFIELEKRERIAGSYYGETLKEKK